LHKHATGLEDRQKNPLWKLVGVRGGRREEAKERRCKMGKGRVGRWWRQMMMELDGLEHNSRRGRRETGGARLKQQNEILIRLLLLILLLIFLASGTGGLTKEGPSVTAEDVKEGKLSPFVCLGEDPAEVTVMWVEEGKLVRCEDGEG
jgi:hypothetical protein